MEEDRLSGRDGDVWQSYVAGETQSSIGKRHGITQSRVCQIIADVRSNMPRETKDEVIQKSLELLHRLQLRVVRTAEQADDPKVLTDCVRTLVQMQDRQSKFLGLDAAVKVEAAINENEAHAAAVAAAEAARRLAGS